ncbi:MAG: sporulation protein YabP [Bacillota bacterium]
MEDRKAIRPRIHNITIEGREKMTVSGVKDVSSFDENTILLSTEMGGLSIKGTGLHINKLNVEDGNLYIEGFVISCTYMEKSENRKSGGFFSSIFK